MLETVTVFAIRRCITLSFSAAGMSGPMRSDEISAGLAVKSEVSCKERKSQVRCCHEERPVLLRLNKK